MKKTTRTGRRALSVFLSLLMLLSAWVFVAPTASAGLAVSGSLPTFTFYVPETIYLDPSDNKTFKYYVDREHSENGMLYTSSASTNGYYDFICSGATNISISCNASSPSLSKTSASSSPLSGQINGGALSSAISMNSVALITWTVTFTYDGNQYSANAYTTAYAPNRNVTANGAAGFSGNNNVSSYSSGIIYIQGAQTTNTATMVKQDDFHGADVYNYQKINDRKLDPLVEGIATPNDYNPNTYSTSSSPFTGATKSYGGCVCVSAENYGDNDDWTGHITCNKTPAEVIVDTSRYSNISQIPNLKLGYMVTDYEGSNARRHSYVSDCTSKVTNPNNLSSATFSVSGDSKTADLLKHSYWRSDTFMKIVYGSTQNTYGTILWESSGSSSPSLDGDAQGSNIDGSTDDVGKKYLEPINYAVSGSGGTTIRYFRGCASGNKSSSYSMSCAMVLLKVTTVSKADLRSLVNTCVGTYMQPFYTSSTWSTYNTKLQNAYKALGNPSATASDISTATSELNTAKNALTRATGTATVTHKSSTGKTLETETKSYSYGQNVTASSKTFNAYSYTSVSPSSLTAKNVKSSTTAWTMTYTPDDYTITYDAAGGTAVSAKTYNIESTGTLGSTSKAGYDFSGWKTGAAAGSWSASTTYAGSTSLTGKYGSPSVTAQYTPHIIAATLNRGSGTGGTSTVYYKYQQAGTYSEASNCNTTISSITKPTRLGYTFKGYYQYANGVGKQFIDETGAFTDQNLYNELGQSKTLTLFADWQQDIYTVSFPANTDASPLTVNGADAATITVVPVADYHLTDSVQVLVGNTALTRGTDYTFTFGRHSATIAIASGKIGAPVTVNVGVEACSVGTSGTAATCQEAAVCGTCGEMFGLADPNAHAWTAVSYSWNSDYSACTASRTCTIPGCTTGTQTETAAVATTVQTKDPTCYAKGETTYTCAAFTNPAFEVQSITLADIPQYEHTWDYAQASYTWNADNSVCTATVPCGRGCGYSFPAIASSSVIVDNVKPTCLAEGRITYTAFFSGRPQLGKTKVVELGYGNHDLGELQQAQAGSNCQTRGTVAHYTCALCGRYFEDSAAQTEITNLNENGEYGPHSFTVPQFDSSDHWMKCQNCEEKDGITAHTYSGEPTWGEWTAENTISATVKCDGCPNTTAGNVTVTPTEHAATYATAAFTTYTAVCNGASNTKTYFIPVDTSSLAADIAAYSAKLSETAKYTAASLALLQTAVDDAQTLVNNAPATVAPAEADALVGQFTDARDAMAEVVLELNTYSVLWKNGDAVLETDEDALYGSMPDYGSDEPARTAQDYVYTFIGWNTDANATEALATLPEVNGNLTFFAIFSKVEREYPVQWVYGSDNVKATANFGYSHTFVSADVPAAITESKSNTQHTTFDWSAFVGRTVSEFVEAQTTDVVLAADAADQNHTGTAEYTWTGSDAAGYTACTAALTCTVCGAEVSETAENEALTKTKTFEAANCQQVNAYNYEAAFANSLFALQSKHDVQSAESGPHDYQNSEKEPSFTWNTSDSANVTCTATQTCKYCDETEAFPGTVTVEDTVPATCMAGEQTVFQAAFEGFAFGPVFSEPVVTAPADPQAHAYGEYDLNASVRPVYDEATGTWSDATLVYHCSNTAVYDSETGTTTYDASHDKAETVARADYSAFDAAYAKLEEIPTLDIDAATAVQVETANGTETVAFGDLLANVNGIFANPENYPRNLIAIESETEHLSEMTAELMVPVQAIFNNDGTVKDGLLNTYTVTWMNGETELDTDTGVVSGSVVTYSGSTPTKASDALNNYTFLGWNTDSEATQALQELKVTGNTVYYAIFNAVPKGQADYTAYDAAFQALGAFAAENPTIHADEIAQAIANAADQAHPGGANLTEDDQADVDAAVTVLENALSAAQAAKQAAEELAAAKTAAKNAVDSAAGSDTSEAVAAIAADYKAQIDAAADLEAVDALKTAALAQITAQQEKEAAIQTLAQKLTQTQTRYNEVKDDETYTQESRDALKNAIDAAEALLADDTAATEALTASADSLENAVNGLQFVVIPTYTVTFVVDGEMVDTQIVEHGSSAPVPEMDPYRFVEGEETHKKFSGWTGNYTNVTADSTVTATYDPENHEWVEGEVTLAATCMATGTRALSCVCGATSEKTLPVNPSNHTRQNTTTTRNNEVSPTCSAEGSYDEMVLCECGDPLRFTHKIIPKLPHTAGTPTRENETAATCTDAAAYVEVVNCTVCGAEISRTDKTEGNALGHDWSDWVVRSDSTCSEPGSKTRTCARCGNSEDAVIDIKAHLDENSDTVCDLCGAPLANHRHKDEDFDNLCDTCGNVIDTGYRCSWCSRNDRVQAGSDPQIYKIIIQIIHFIVHSVGSIKVFSFK